MNQREEILRRLIALSGKLSELRSELARLPWDSPEVATLTALNARGVLTRFCDGALAESELTEWAEMIESREDIKLEEAKADELKELIFELANPDINGPITLPRVKEWIGKLEA